MGRVVLGKREKNKLSSGGTKRFLFMDDLKEIINNFSFLFSAKVTETFAVGLILYKILPSHSHMYNSIVEVLSIYINTTTFSKIDYYYIFNT